MSTDFSLQSGIVPEVVREMLDRVLSASVLRNAESQRAFLRYAVEQVLAGRGAFVKEYSIGVEALGRPESFDPRIDPIVRTQARKLRANLEKYYATDGAADPIRIELPKGTYAPVFARAITDAPDAIVPRADPAPAPSKPRVASVWLAAGASLVLLMVWGVRYLGGAATERTVAVLPFATIGDAGKDAFLSDGLTQDLINSLGRVPGLRVAGRTSTFRYQNKDVNPQRAGRELHASVILVGSVRRNAGRTEIAAQLIETGSGARLWTGNYELPEQETQDIGADITQAVASTLANSRSGFGFGWRARPAGAAPPKPAAYQSYLRGLYFWNKLTAASLKTAIRYFEDAIAQDPSFARAYTALADSYVMAPMVATAPSPDVVARIRAAAQRALELDPTLGEAHIDLAICAEYDFDWDTAEREFKQGLELSPSNAVAHLWYAKLLAIRGRKSEVLAQRKIAAELDPVSPYAVQSLGGYHSVMGQYDDAIRYFTSALELEPNFGFARQG